MTTLYQDTAALLDRIQAQQALIARLSWNATLRMYRPAGFEMAVEQLSCDTTYTVVLCDIDKMKAINEATGCHMQTDRYLAAGLQVRGGEISGQVHDKGDEFAFVIAEHTPGGQRRRGHSANAFVARIARQLAGQPLTVSERYALAAAQRCPVEETRLSATFSAMSGVRGSDVLDAIEWLSSDVLRLKAERDSEVMA